MQAKLIHPPATVTAASALGLVLSATVRELSFFFRVCIFSKHQK